MSELEIKLERARELMAERKVGALWLRLASSFAWATCGKSAYINTASSYGAASVLITQDRRYIITNNIEEPRLAGEEGLRAAGWEFPADQWYAPSGVVARLTEGKKVAVDDGTAGVTDLSGPVARLRANLLPEEDMRFRALGRLCADAMNAAIRAVKPGMTEFEIAALLGSETQRRGAQPIVNLIATDERIFRYRHPLPTGKQLEKYAMLVLCGRQDGLVCSITRLIHFGPLSEELQRKQEAVAQIDATFVYTTRPNVTFGDIFAQVQEVYARTGFGDEWRLHHQGGPAGYEPREYLGLPGSQDQVRAGEAYAWNPSITGTKSEDTFLVGGSENEIITGISDWPMIPVEVGGQIIERPAILEV